MLESFAIGQYPVTHAEWRCFMEAGGYNDERWWPTESAKAWQNGTLKQTERIDWFLETYKGLQEDFEGFCKQKGYNVLDIENFKSWFKHWPTEDKFAKAVEESYKPQKYREPKEWLNARFNNPAQPVVGICWYEALAYCLWLSEQSGRLYKLPSEAQWEAAAAGASAEAYPWGNHTTNISIGKPLANTMELHLRRTNPVGLFAEGARKTQTKPLFDLAGNCWEWCQSTRQAYPVKPDDARDRLDAEGERVLRGGAWDDSAHDARAASRNYDHPYYRSSYLGFRVLCCPP